MTDEHTTDAQEPQDEAQVDLETTDDEADEVKGGRNIRFGADKGPDIIKHN
jgi:hypothetical protein